MSRYLLRRFIEAIPLLLLISIAVFTVLQLLPAGPLSIYENEPSMTEADLQRLRETGEGLARTSGPGGQGSSSQARPRVCPAE